MFQWEKNDLGKALIAENSCSGEYCSEYLHRTLFALLPLKLT